MTIFGYNTLGASTDGNWPNYVIGCRYLTSAAGTLQSITFYASGGSGTYTIRLAIYSDSSGSPNTLIEDLGTATATANTWCTVNSSLNPSLTASTYYWLAFKTPNFNAFDSGAANQMQSDSGQGNTSVAFAGTWPGVSYQAAEQVSIYATYTTSGPAVSARVMRPSASSGYNLYQSSTVLR